MTFTRDRLWWALDVVWLAALAVFVLAGRDDVPFHGDESSHLYMSRDYHYLVQQRDLDPVLYDPTPADGSAQIQQDLRLLNGTIYKMSVGLIWDLSGLTVDDLNGPWAWWGASDEWRENIRLGHMPGAELLRIGRSVSCAYLILSVIAIFAIARMIVPHRLVAYATSAIYVTNAPVLLNGRRAMLEGAMLCFTTLTVLVALWIARRQTTPGHDGWRDRVLAGLYGLLGIAGGFAVASKHSAAMVVAAAFLAVLLAPLVRPAPDESPQATRRARWIARVRALGWPHVLRVAGAGLLVVVVFVALTPAWWAHTLDVPGRVLDDRQALLDGQAAMFGGYDGFGERLSGLVEQAFFAEPQYYEVPIWAIFVADDAAAYEDAGFAGRRGGPIWGALLVLVFALGLGVVTRRWREGVAWTVLVWLVVTALAVLALTPMAWQRYYLPLQAPVAVVAGIGMWRALELARGMQRRLLQRWDKRVNHV